MKIPKCRSGMPVVESTNHESHGMGHVPLETHLVYVNFYTYEDAKQVRMILNEYTAFDDILQKANELLPTCRWRIFSGTDKHVSSEFKNSRQVWDAIKQTSYYEIRYLEVRMIKIGGSARCDGCYREIFGSRYKCTECSDFDLCGVCELGPIHSFHKLIKI
ncbi:hypothetical protein B9Z55_021310 [Caenorhabditis nigoni]|uniref:ZZ-type domain-containing protein n=2 Tax=Caenorhabditis nigoni TaxID=1611254 RepID=A0A2G5TRD7_9PELO|nr:hypothetical protein B9Z55_021310 [Caenorhabditis nigoni]